MRTVKLLGLLICMLVSCQLYGQYQEETFFNNDNMQVSDNGPAATYPSTTNVTGLPNNLAYIKVTFVNLNHPWSTSQFDILLEAPNGERIILLSDADPDFGNNDIDVLHIDSDATSYVLEDEFSFAFPYSLPTQIGPIDEFPIIGTFEQDNPSYDVLQNINPNGSWKLYVVDDNEDFGGGSIGSWSLTIGASTNAVCDRPVGFPIIDNVNRNTAIISWTDLRTTNWDLLYTAVDTFPGYDVSPSIENINGQSVMLSDLDYDTEYAVYLRADCNGNNTNPSRWNGPIDFTTESGVCANAEDISLCDIAIFDPNLYRGGFFDPCNNGNGFDVPQMMFNFSPPKTGDYYFYTYQDDEQINSLSIRSQEEVNFCDSLNWNCLAIDFTEDILLENLQQGTTYKILIHDYNYFEFQISECPEFIEIELEEFIPHSFDVDFYLTAEEEPIEGEVEIYYELSGGSGPANITVPLNSDDINDGVISTVSLSLEEDTSYDLYVRQLCTNGVGCWQGPYEFSTDKHCGDIDNENLLITTTTATTAWIQTEDPDLELHLARVVLRDSFFDQPDYADDTNAYPIGSNSNSIFVYDLDANTTYTYYLKLSCFGNDFASQYWQGPFTLETSGDCFVEVENLYCGQCYLNEIGPRTDPSIPFYNIGMNDLFPGNDPDNCDNLDYTPRLERIYEYNALQDGTISLERGQKKTCSGSEFLVQYYYKSANLPCDINDWNYLGCWTHEGNDIYDDIIFEVKKDSTYYIMLDYAGTLCPGANDGPHTWIIVEGDNCKNPCQPVDNLTAMDNGDGFFNIEWDETVDALGYDIIVSKAHENVETLRQCSSDDIIDALGTSLYPNTSITLNVDSLLANLDPSNPRSVYVRSRCAEDNYSIWQEVSIAPEVAFQSSYNNNNTLNYCSPLYDRSTLTPTVDIPYDIIEFTVEVSGTYYFRASSFNSDGTYAAVYENNFDPTNPAQNIIFEDENTALANLIFSLDLDAGVPYIFMGNHRIPVENRKLYTLEVNGPAPFSADKFTYRGTHDGPQGVVQPTNGQYYQSNKICRDDAGWFHYYYSDPLDPSAQDLVLLSIEDYYQADPNYIFPDNIAYAGGKFGTSLITNPPADYVSNPDGWWTMNRYWDLDLFPNLQPEVPVGVRFYYTENDLFSLRSSTGNFDLDHEDLNFYKINDSEDDYNIDPSDGHAGIPLAEECAALGIWEYFNAPFADTSFWRFDSIPSGYYAEMQVHSFSGGGGGAGSFAPQQDSDMDGFVDAIDCDPNNPEINPDAVEIPYDGLDNDCNPLTLDDDFDMDGYGLAEDCDDNNPQISPGLPEIPYDGIDNDCNPDTWDDDVDMDGFLVADDCDDQNALVNPSEDEITYDGLDNDCDPTTLDDDLDQDGFNLEDDCDDNDASINPASAEIVYDGIDNDCDPLTLDDDLDEDGFALTDDCDDENPNINPDADEIPNNGIDEDCDGMDLVTSIYRIPENQLDIHPNPTAKYLFVEEKGLNQTSIVLFDALGKKLLEQNLQGMITIDLSNFAEGVYFLKVNADEGEVVRRVVKM